MTGRMLACPVHDRSETRLGALLSECSRIIIRVLGGALASHRRRWGTVVALVLLLSVAPASSAHAAETTTSLMKKVSASGLGCKKIVKSEAILLGTRLTCVVSTETVSIEVFAAKNFKKATGLACAFGVRYIAVTDNKTWIIVPESRATAQRIAKPLKASVKVFCPSGQIINESKVKASPTPKPAAKGSITVPYRLGETFSVGDYRLALLSVTGDSTMAVCESFQGRFLVPELCEEKTDSNFDSVVGVDPAATDRYVQFVIRIENAGKVIVRPEFQLLVQMTSPTGTLLNQELTFSSNSLLNWDQSLVPGGFASYNTFFKLPKSADLLPLRLVVRSLVFGVDSTVYVALN
jgi:hypothetical protein